MKHMKKILAAVMAVGMCGMMLYGVKVKGPEAAVEDLDLESNEPISFDTFADLIKVKEEKNLPYIVARVVTSVGGKDHVTYYDAHLLNYFLFKILGREPLNEIGEYADIQRVPLVKLDYFIINEPTPSFLPLFEGSESRTQEFRHLCSFDDLKANTAHWAAEFYKNQPAPADQPLTPEEVLERAHSFYFPYNPETHEALEPDYARAFADFQQVAEQTEDPVAAAQATGMLGDMYREGKGTDQNYALAIEYYRRAADQLYDVYEAMEALEHLGDMYTTGEGVAKNAATARDYYEQVIAKADDAAIPADGAYAQVKLGDMDYEEGLYDQARQHYEKADEQGDAAIADTNYSQKAEAQLKLGKMYLNGEGVQQNSDRAREYFKGVLLSNQLGYVDDEIVEEAIKHLKQIDGEGGVMKAQLELGKKYAARQERDKAFEHLKPAADQRDDIEIAIKALIEMGNLSYHIYDGYPDYDQALQDYNQAVKLAEEHNISQEAAAAYEKLGDMYYYGFGVASNRDQAIAYYEKAAIQNKYPLVAMAAKYELGTLYFYAGDYTKAREYLEAMVDSPDMQDWMKLNTQRALARMHSQGQGGPVDRDRARTYFNNMLSNKAASDGDKQEAQQYLNGVAASASNEQPAPIPVTNVVNNEPVAREVAPSSSPSPSNEQQVSGESAKKRRMLDLGIKFLQEGSETNYARAIENLAPLVNQTNDPQLAKDAEPYYKKAIAGIPERIEQLRTYRTQRPLTALEEDELKRLKNVQKALR